MQVKHRGAPARGVPSGTGLAPSLRKEGVAQVEPRPTCPPLLNNGKPSSSTGHPSPRPSLRDRIDAPPDALPRGHTKEVQEQFILEARQGGALPVAVAAAGRSPHTPELQAACAAT
jgi:hypothetical protein